MMEDLNSSSAAAAIYDPLNGPSSPNPYMMELILKKMMSQMSKSELVNARLVSGLWDKCAVSQLEILQNDHNCQRQKFVRISGSYRYEIDLNKFQEETPNRQLFTKFELDITEYLDKMVRNPSVNIFLHYNITSLSLAFDEDLPFRWGHVRHILNLIAPTIVNLKLEFQEVEYRFKTGQELETCPEHVTYPNLEKISLVIENTWGVDFTDQYFEMLAHIFHNSPKLKELKMDDHPENKTAFSIFCSLRDQIETLDIWQGREKYGILLESEDLQNLQVQVTNMKCYIDTLLGARAIMEILDSGTTLGQNLESLSIAFSVMVFPDIYLIQLPTLVNLKVLHLECRFMSADGWLIFGTIKNLKKAFQPFDFQEKFPNLVKFEVNHWNNFEKVVQTGSTTLKWLKIENEFQSDYFSELKKITRKFPQSQVSVLFYNTPKDLKQLNEPHMRIKVFRIKNTIEKFALQETFNLANLQGVVILNLTIDANSEETKTSTQFDALKETLILVGKSLKFLKLLEISCKGFSSNEVEILENIADDIREELPDLLVDLSSCIGSI